MRAMGWTRKELEEHSKFEIEMHLAILEYRAAQQKQVDLHTDHEIAQAELMR